MAFAPPRRPKTNAASSTQKSLLPVPSPTKKSSNVPLSSGEAIPKKTDSHEARVIPSRYAQAAAARQAVPVRISTIFKTDPIGRDARATPKTATSTCELKASSAGHRNASPARKQLRTTSIDEKEERELLSLRILQNTQTIHEGTETLRQYKLSAEKQLEQRWQHARKLNMNHQLEMVQFRMQRDAEELQSLGPTEIHCLETFVTRVNTIEEQCAQMTEAFDSWSVNIAGPISTEWIRVNEHLRDVCRSTRLIIAPLAAYINQAMDAGIVSETTHDLVSFLNAVTTLVDVQKTLARDLWQSECIKIDERFERLKDSVKADPLGTSFIWDQG